MKKLIYLLVLSLCLGTLTTAVPAWSQPALAEDAESSEEAEKAKKKAEEEAAKKKAEEEAKKKAEEEAKKKAEEEAKKKAEEEAKKKAEEEAKKKAEEEAAKKKAEEEEAKKKAEEEEARKKAEEEAAKKKAEEEEAKKKAEEEEAKKKAEKEKQNKSDKKEKESDDKGKKEENEEKEYSLDLDGSSAFLLSEALKAAKIDIHLDSIKAIEPENKGVVELLAWERVKKGSDDFTFTVLKDFKEAKLRIVTKKASLILVLKKGRKAEAPEPAKQAAEPEAPKAAEEKAPEEKAPEENAPEEKAPEEKTPEAQEPTEVGNDEPEPEKPEHEEAAPEGDAPAPAPTEAEQAQPENVDAAPDTEETDGEPIAEAQTDDAESADAEPTAAQGDAGEAAEPNDEGDSEGQEGEGSGEEQGSGAEQGDGQPDGEPGGELEDGSDGALPGNVAVPEDAEAWFSQDGAPAWGTLTEVVGMLRGGETVYLRAAGKLYLPDAPLALLATVTFSPDDGVFEDSNKVHISTDDPDKVDQPALIEPSALAGLGEKADLYFWVAKPEQELPEPSDPDNPVLTVTVTGYQEATWCAVSPEFTLSGIPEGKNWSYAAIIYDQRFVPISTNPFVPNEQGIFTLRFAMLDELDDIMATSEEYTLWLDWTVPEEVDIYTDEEESYTLHIEATDSMSGVEAISLDGGKMWHKVVNGETFTYTGKKEKTFEAGEIQVRDAAGNIWLSTEEYTIEEVEGGGEDEGGGEGGGGGGLGGEGGKGTPVLSHASGDSEEGAEYDALLLELPNEPMRQLTVGGEPMELTLTLEAAEEPGAPVGDRQPFTAYLRRWDGSDDDAPDTLLLTAEMDGDLGDKFTYEWRFNGEVYRLLANSGIKYIALQVGDDIAAFPTEGFTGGTKYTELKMLGVSTKKFDYSLAMRVNLDPGHVSTMSDNDYSQECDLSIHTEVENMDYELSSSPNSIMYFYNVFLGPEDMLNQPFGEYRAHG